jgi:hypothetical protein
VRDPALILVAELMGSEDAAHAKDRSRQAKDARVVQDVLIRRALRTAVRAVKVESAVLVDAGAHEQGYVAQRLRAKLHLV